MILRIFIIFIISFTSSHSQSINLNGAINQEAKLKGAKFKEFFTDHEFTVTRGKRNITFKFNNKVYEIFENNEIVQKGTWKMNMLKNNIRLKPHNGAKSIYLSKLKDKPILFQYNTRPGKENTIRTTYKISQSNKNNIAKQIEAFKDGTAKGYDVAMEKKKSRASNALSKAVSSALGVAGNFNGQFGSSSEVTHYFFQASENYLTALEYLHRAYDNNVEADKMNASLVYMKNSKISEGERLKSTKLIIDNSSSAIRSNIQNSSMILSEVGRSYYEKSLPYAFAAIESSISLYSSVVNTANNVQSTGGSFESMFANMQDVGAVASILPELPTFVKNIHNTAGLVFSGAKEKKIRDNGNLNAKLAELDLDID